jgi:hypothetical protein
LDRTAEQKPADLLSGKTINTPRSWRRALEPRAPGVVLALAVETVAVRGREAAQLHDASVPHPTAGA